MDELGATSKLDAQDLEKDDTMIDVHCIFYPVSMMEDKPRRGIIADPIRKFFTGQLVVLMVAEVALFEDLAEGGN